MADKITSTSNPLVKEITRLQKKSSARSQSAMFVAEGRREASLAMQSGHHILTVVVCPEIFAEDPSYPVISAAINKPGMQMVEVSRAVYDRLAYRAGTEGVLVTGMQRAASLETWQTNVNPLILVLEGIEKPGNLGAILRTAEAAGVDAVILADPVVDLYNPNVIRGSLGCVFTMPVFVSTSVAVIAWLKKRGITIFAAALQTMTDYYRTDFRQATALVFGAEDKGLSALWRKDDMRLIKIPMAGRIDSLNVSASVAVLCFEAIRQRSSG